MLLQFFMQDFFQLGAFDELELDASLDRFPEFFFYELQGVSPRSLKLLFGNFIRVLGSFCM